MVEIRESAALAELWRGVSVLYREPMWLKFPLVPAPISCLLVSVLYREPMWLKLAISHRMVCSSASFSALP